jgi:hydroxyethylthiazole kinase
MIAADDILTRIRTQKPVVHHLTNWVTIYDCAQILKSIGASPVMAHAPEEVADMVGIASALVLNIGTLTSDFVDAMKVAACAANQKGIPVVLDACGVGATPFRDQKALELLTAARINIIKGNASEIARLAGRQVTTKGVDAAEVKDNLQELASTLSGQFSAVVVITGREDLVTDGRKSYRVANGHELMTSVVGTGCMAASVIGAFAAVEADWSLAAACALADYGIAAELAAMHSAGPAAFKQQLFDSFYSLTSAIIRERVRIATATA